MSLAGRWERLTSEVILIWSLVRMNHRAPTCRNTKCSLRFGQEWSFDINTPVVLFSMIHIHRTPTIHWSPSPKHPTRKACNSPSLQVLNLMYRYTDSPLYDRLTPLTDHLIPGYSTLNSLWLIPTSNLQGLCIKGEQAISPVSLVGWHLKPGDGS